MLKKFLNIAILSMVSSAALAYSETKQLQHIATQFLHQHRAEEQITALAMTVQSPNHPQPINIYKGTVSLKQRTAVTQESLFQVGSIGKSFITAVLLKLESDPKNHFNINDPLTKYFPQYTNWRHVTVRELMNMTSGIPDYFSDTDILTAYAQHPYYPHNRYNWVARIHARRLLFTPGTKFNYSNTNYLILGMLIEKISGRSLTEEITNVIIKPLKLEHTYFVSNQPNASLRAKLVHGYQNQDNFADYIPRGTDVTLYSLTYLGAAGGIISTSADVSKWIHALFTPGQVLTQREFNKMISLISQNTGQPVHGLSNRDPHAFGLGIGVEYGANLKTPFYIYQGITFGYRAMYVYIPSRHTSIVVTVNSDFTSKTNHLTDLINQIGAVVI